MNKIFIFQRADWKKTQLPLEWGQEIIMLDKLKGRIMNKLKIIKHGRKNFKCIFLGHFWIKEKDTGITQYWKCPHCGRREIIQYTEGGYQPIDNSFLNDGFLEEYLSEGGDIAEKTIKIMPKS